MAFRVVVILEFDDVLYPNGSAADDVIDLLTDECEQLREEFHADRVWVENAYMTEEMQND